MLLDDDVAGLHLEIVVERAAPAVLRKGLALARRDLRVGRMLPVLVIARLRAVVGHEEDADAGPVRRGGDGAEMIERYLLGDLASHAARVAALAQEVVVGVDRKDGHRGSLVGCQMRQRHGGSPGWGFRSSMRTLQHFRFAPKRGHWAALLRR